MPLTITRDDVAETLDSTGYYSHVSAADLLGCVGRFHRWWSDARTLGYADATWPVVVDSLDADWLGVLDRFSLAGCGALS
jgi:hypothetical protein